MSETITRAVSDYIVQRFWIGEWEDVARPSKTRTIAIDLLEGIYATQRYPMRVIRRIEEVVYIHKDKEDGREF